MHSSLTSSIGAKFSRPLHLWAIDFPNHCQQTKKTRQKLCFINIDDSVSQISCLAYLLKNYLYLTYLFLNYYLWEIDYYNRSEWSQTHFYLHFMQVLQVASFLFNITVSFVYTHTTCWILSVNLLRYHHKSFLTSSPSMLHFGQPKRWKNFHWLI